ncbi:hypothetical protein Vadar_002001 [Vaccinium darrowii]|uniref:Uncharacterized protein n=1 Tax=Vaccinium darrowii TaxID=229202 RepID=A0ACB7YIM8_9ERIC|nr:hypothetical protein Vadar_002001 [Vaccinium darrowii]
MAFDGEILEIFSCLPAKPLMKFTSVCKTCNDYVSNPFFIEKQSRKMQSNSDSSFFIQPNSCKRSEGKLEYHVFPGEANSTGVPNESVEFVKNNGRVLASSNGLIVCRKHNSSSKAMMEDQLFICNPVTRSYLGIPTPEGTISTDQDLLIFFHCNIDMYDQFPGDYLLMSMEVGKDWSNTLSCKVYIPQKKTWIEAGHIDCGGRNLQFEDGVYQNDTVYFLSDWSLYFSKNSRFHWPYVVAFDPKECKSRFIKVPKDARRGLDDQSCKMSIFPWKKDKSICLVKLLKGVLMVWVLRDFKLGSWSRILKIRARAVSMDEPNPSIAGFAVLNGKTLVFATAETLYQYDLTGDRRSRRVRVICRHQCGKNVLISSYSSTLRPCGDGARVVA